VASVTLYGSKAPAPSQASVTVFAGQDIGGNAIIDECFALADGACLTANPALHKALQQLAGTSQGPVLLRTAAKTGVSVRLGSAGAKFDAAFDPKARTVTLDPSLTTKSSRGQAAILANQLRFVSIWAGPAGVLPYKGLTCVQESASAEATELAVWKELRSAGPPTDELETTEDKLAQAMDSQGLGFWLNQAMRTSANCG
jgi:hypothetical protein